MASEAPAPKLDPFLTRDILCPVCQRPSPQRRLKRHLFPEKSRDVDLRPLAYQLLKPGLENYHPLLYYLWHCPYCRHTAWPGAYENPVQGLALTINRYREAWLPVRAPDRPEGRVIRVLVQGLGGGSLDHLQGVRLHLLAVHQVQTLARLTGVGDGINLGRYALRLSWLYRELEERPAWRPLAQQAAQLALALHKDWPQAPAQAEQAALLAAQSYQEALASPGALAGPVEECTLRLLVARIYIKLRLPDEAAKQWNVAHTLARQVDGQRQALETQYYQQEQRARSDVVAVAQMAREGLAELSQKVVELDSQARSMRFKAQEVKNLISDLAEDLRAGPELAPDPGTGEIYLSLEPAKKPKKKLRDFFK